MTESLLEPSFLRRLERLKLLARRRFAGAAGGARRSSRRGASPEFADHRPYYPGDDVRRIDWNAFARLDELVLRLFVAEEDLTLYLLCDTSRSLAFGEPTKLDQARRIAAALAYVGLSGSERVSVVPFADTGRRPLPPTRGKRRTGAVLRYLESLEASGATDLGAAVDRFLARKPPAGLVVLLSDLLDPQGFERPINRLLSERHDVVMFHVLSAEELEPERLLSGADDLLLLDSEGAEAVELTLDRASVEAYRARLRRFLDGAEGYAKRRGIGYFLVGGGASFEEALLRYLRAA